MRRRCSSGRYHGSAAAAEKLLPFGAGFEAVGTAVAVASNVQSVLEPRTQTCIF